MFDSYRKSILFLKGSMRTSPFPWLCVLLQHSPSPPAPKYRTATTSTTKKQSLRLNYLVNNCGFSPETASEVSKYVSFLNSEKPDAVLTLFRNLNISDSQLRDIIKKEPGLLSSNPVKNIWPKLEFLKSKGASSSQIAHIVTTYPRFLLISLGNQIIPLYDLMNSFLHSDERTITSIKRCPGLMADCRFAHKVKLLLDYGVPEPGIALLLRHWPGIMNFQKDKLKTKVDEIKTLGFHPSKISFIEALRTKVIVSKSSWERKVELFGKWGWSDETLHRAFTKRPFCMLISDGKIEAVMEFFVNHMGWDSLMLAEYPVLFSFSLEKRIIPRASVLQFLQSRGLIREYARASPFFITKEMFHQKFVNCFKDEAPQLLKLYKEKMNTSR